MASSFSASTLSVRPLMSVTRTASPGAMLMGGRARHNRARMWKLEVDAQRTDGKQNKSDARVGERHQQLLPERRGDIGHRLVGDGQRHLAAIEARDRAAIELCQQVRIIARDDLDQM